MTWLVLPAASLGGRSGEWALIDTTRPAGARVRATFADWAEAQAMERLMAEKVDKPSYAGTLGGRLRFEAEQIRQREPF